MIKYIYTYWKKKAAFYTEPVTNNFEKDVCVELAQRAFTLNKGTDEHEQQKDVDLYYLGTFDDCSGEYHLVLKPEYLCSFVDGEEDGREEDQESN